MFVLDRAARRVARARAMALRILAVWTAELEHEPVDDAVKMQTVVEAALRELDEVVGRERHQIRVQLDHDVAERGLESGGGVWHGDARD